MKKPLLALVCSLGLLPLSCRETGARRPNLLVIVVDTLRADRLGAYGNQRGLTPFLDSLAARGTVFANAYAPSSWTVPSVASLFTSRYASQHGTTTFAARLAEDEVTLAERLAAGGYSTLGLSANFRLSRDVGFAQGFRHWRTYVPVRRQMAAVGGDRLRLDAVASFERMRAEWPTRPLFLYLQYMEPHWPYDPPEPERERLGLTPAVAVQAAEANAKLGGLRFDEITASDRDLLAALYDAEVAAVDTEIRRLFQRLERRGFLQNAVVVVTSDHGEDLGEHAVFSHGYSLYETAIRVPLLVVAPGRPGGRVVNRNVSLLDLAPTLVELAGLPAEPRFEGRSLVPLLAGSAGAAEGRGASEAVSELPETGSALDLRQHEKALVRGSEKLLVEPNGAGVVFDLERDPAENAPLGAERSAAAGDLARALEERLAALRANARPARESAEIDEATREKLRALGYHQ